MKRIRLLAILAGVGLLAVGMALPATGSQGRWLACLAASGLLIAIGIWPRNGDAETEVARPIINVAIVIAVMFGMVAIQLMRMQILAAGALTRQRGEDPATGDVISNPREVNADLRIARGRIVDRNGITLAESVNRQGTFVRRYPVPGASYVAGYFSPLKFGAAGLEQSFNAYLRGDETANPVSAELDVLLGRRPRGADLRLTLDVPLQELAHQLIGDRVGAAVLLDTKTGAVLALASSPHHDPSALVAFDLASAEAAQAAWDELNEDSRRPLLIRSTSGLYPPGSTFKTITAAAAVDSGIATAGTIYEDDGELEVDGRIIIEENRPDDSIDEWTLRDGLAFSLNVVFARVGLELGADRLSDYASRFGVDRAAPFDVPVAAGQIASSDAFLESPAALADTAFGQGELLVTPLGMALVAAAFVNDGILPRPYLVDRVIDRRGRAVRSHEPSPWLRAVDRETAVEMVEMMRYVVTDGYAQAAAIPGVDVGGKTGTAEVGDGEPHSWFIGFGGSRERQLAVAVVLERGGIATTESITIARELLAAGIGER